MPDTGEKPGRYVLKSADHRGIRWRQGERLEQLFEERCDALRDGGGLAVDGPAERLTYAELDRQANKLARFLIRRHGVRPGDRIGLLFDEAADGYASMLAVLKAHAVYVPLDAGFPPDRLSYIISDASVRMVLTSSRLRGLITGAEAVCLDEAAGRIVSESDERIELADTHSITGNDRIYQGLTISFDFAVEEIWVPWMAGATLVPKPRGGNLLGPELSEFLHDHQVSALCCVPTLLATLDADLPDLTFLLVSGEPCPRELAERWHRPDRRFLDVYRPTEATVSATWTKLRPGCPVMTIGVLLPTYSVAILDPNSERNFLGNDVNYPAGARTGDNCLVATKPMVPLTGPVRADVGLLGSPCFEILQTVERDKRFDYLTTRAERQRRIPAKTRHNIVTIAPHMAVRLLLLTGLIAAALIPMGDQGWQGWAISAGVIIGDLTFAAGLFVVAERVLVRFLPLRPRFCSIYQVEFWRHERYWKVPSQAYLPLFDDTPFKPMMWRLLGVDMGRRVFDNGCSIIERTLTSIGSETTLNMASVLQCHSLEDDTFKSDRIIIGSGCTLGTAAFAHYQVTMDDGSLLGADSFAMKGSHIPAGKQCLGNPRPRSRTPR